LELYKIEEIPNLDIDKRQFFELIGNSMFFIEYNFVDRSTVLGIEGNHSLKVQLLQNFIHGIRFSYIPKSAKPQFEASIISGYSGNSHDIFNEVFSLPIFVDSIIVAFIPVNERELSGAKRFIESILSSKKVRETSSEPQGAFGARSTRSSQREIFEESDEALVLNSTLNFINESILSGGSAYKFFIITPSGNTIIDDYLKSKFLILSYRRIKNFSYDMLGKLRQYPALPFSSAYLSALVSLHGIKVNYVINTLSAKSSGDLDIGTFVEGGVKATETRLKIDQSTLNLGFIITGLPGTGKTTEAMSIADQLLKASKSKIIIIAPTDEWSYFALAHKMNLVRLYNDRIPINFFRKPQYINKEKFYENLAMILASASDAGPYQNPMEKCMLNAFRKVYDDCDTPDPIEVYNAIEDSIIELHAKRTNTGIKYTKHGENIRSALENLRAILSRPEYAAKEGVMIEKLLEQGVVFDISGASASTKQYLYALILNQVYALSSSFDTQGDGELRLAIILEEAQTVFGNKDSTAVQDIKQRIQDFRKQGIGLILLAHNVSDIESGIRRLCQLKLYLRQASDIAPTAVKDLAFAYAKDEDATLKLKMLESGIGALSYISKENGTRIPHDTVFIKTLNYNMATPIIQIDAHNAIRNLYGAIPEYIDTRLSINLYGTYEKTVCFARTVFLGEELCTCSIEQQANDIKVRMLEGKVYTIQLLDRKKRIIKELKVNAKPFINIKIGDK